MVVSSTIFCVFGMTRPEIERQFPAPLANTTSSIYIYIYIYLYIFPKCYLITRSSWLGLKTTPTASLQKSKTLPQWVSRLWHKTIWWWGFRNARALGNVEYPFIVIAPRSTLAWSGSTLFSATYGLDRTKLCAYAKLNCLKSNCLYV